MRTPPPCYNNGADCPDRRVGCRGTCTAWRDWLVIRETERQQIAISKQTDKDCTTFLVERGKRQRQESLRRSQEKRR